MQKAADESAPAIADIRIQRADLPREVQESVFARMVAERGRIAKRYRSEGEEEAFKIRGETDKTATIIIAKAYEESQKLRGEGDGEAAAIYSETFGKDPAFYTFVRSLETYEKGLSDRSLLLLSPDSDLWTHLTENYKQVK